MAGGPAGSAPAAPSGLSASTVSGTQIDLSWTDNSANETGFRVERSPDGSTWAEIGPAAADATSYSDTGLTPGTTYYYRVRAYNASGNSAYAGPVSATTPHEISDTFTGANATPLDGRTLSSGNASWIDLQGDWQIDGNAAHSTTAVSGQGNALAADLGASEQEVTVQLTWGNKSLLDDTVNGYGGLVVRVDPVTGSRIECYIAAELNRCDITENNAGARTNRDMSSAFTPVFGQTYSLRATASGTTIRFYVDDVLMCEWTGATFNQAETHCGLWTWDQLTDLEFSSRLGDDNHRFDAFQATEIE